MLLVVPPMPTTNEKRRGIVLLVVMSLLVLFSAVGISFVYYAEAESVASRTSMEAGTFTTMARPHTDPEKLLTHFLNQLIYGTTDVSSSLRGQDLARNMYGFKSVGGIVAGAASAGLPNNWIRITSANHGLQTDDIVAISGIGGFTKAMGAFPISYVNPSQFDLKNSSALGQTYNPPPPGGTATTVGYWISLNRSEPNTAPFSGAGRVNAPVGLPAPFAALDRDIHNYTYFPADKFLRNPEYFIPVSATPVPPTYVASNVSWTYPDRENLFLGAMNSKGEILSTSFYRAPTTWPTSVTVSRYGALRPDPVLNPFFPPVPVGEIGGDVKNVDNAKSVFLGTANNDSRWMHIGHPILTGPDGRKYTVLFAPFIIDMDGKINVNVHGNKRVNTFVAGNTRNASNHGLGPWEVSLAPVLPNTYTNILAGLGGLPGRYGKDGSPGALTNSITFPTAAVPFYSGFDLDGSQWPTAPTPPILTAQRVLLPGETGNPNARFYSFPYIPPTTFGNAAPAERLNHPALFNYFNPTYTLGGGLTADDRNFGPVNMEALLRHGSAGSPSSLSDIYRLCTMDFPNNRLKLTTMSFDTGRPGGKAWLDASSSLTTAPYRMRAGKVMAATNPGVITITSDVPHNLLTNDRVIIRDVQGNAGANGIWQVTVGGPMTFALNGSVGTGPYTSGGTWSEPYATGAAFGTPGFPTPTFPASPTTGDFSADWRSVAGRMTKLPLNKRFTDYPTPANTGRIAVPAAFQTVQAERQAFAKQVYEQLRLATMGILPGSPAYTVTYPSGQYSAHQWLAQLAVNMVDFMDQDDYITPFKWADPKFITATKPVAAPPSAVQVTSANHGLTTGAQIEISNATDPAANNTLVNPLWTVTVLDANNFTLNGSSTSIVGGAVGFWTSGPHAGVWVYGTEMPKLLMNEAYAEMENDPADPGGAMMQATLPFRVSVWLELFNPLTDSDPNVKDAVAPGTQGAVRLRIPQIPPFPAPPVTASYPVYRIQIIKPGAGYAIDPNLGEPKGGVGGDVLTEVNDYTPAPLPTPQPTCNQEIVLANTRGGTTNYAEANGQNNGFYLLGPAALAFPGSATATLRLPDDLPGKTGLRYELPLTGPLTETERLFKPKVLLRRLACPHLPPDPLRFTAAGAPNPNYNPYVTVDTIPALDINDKTTKNVTGVNVAAVPPALKSYGRRQPYAASLMVAQTPDTVPGTPAVIEPSMTEPQHTFFRHNGVQATAPPAVDPFGAAQTVMLPFDWLPHFDRALTSPLDLLHVSMVKPHELTEHFMTGLGAGQRFNHSHTSVGLPPLPAPQVYQRTGRSLWLEGDTRLYRFFEMVDSGYRAQGVSANGRIPGKVNINTAVWANDPADVLMALGDPQVGVSSYAGGEIASPNILTKLLASRTKGPGGLTSSLDVPFKSLGTGLTPGADVFASNGIEDTILRRQDATSLKTLFEVTAPVIPPQTSANPVQRYELLGKLFNNVTTRSNVFAVWVTAGFFDVTDGPITKVASVKTLGGGNYEITPVVMSDTINGVPWKLQAGMHVWVADAAGTTTQHAEITSLPTANSFVVNLSTAPVAGSVIGVKCVLGAEVGAAENKNIRHRMFAIIDRSNVCMPTVLTTTRQLVNLPAGSKTIQVNAAVGTSTWSDNTLTVQSQWSLVPGMRVVIDRGLTGIEETVTITAVNRAANPPTITAVFNLAHAAGATITPEGIVDPVMPGRLYGNPGPQPNFDLRKQSAVVPYFSVIQ